MLKKTLLFIISGAMLVSIFEAKEERMVSAATMEDKTSKSISRPKSSFEIEKEKYSNPSISELESAANYLTKMSDIQAKENIVVKCKINNNIDTSCRNRILSKYNISYEKWNHYFGHIYFYNMEKFSKKKSSTGGGETFTIK